jgi:hypothetical protein
MFAAVAKAFKAERTLTYVKNALRYLGLRTSSGSLAMFAAIRRASSLLSSFAAGVRRTSEAISIMHKSWKPLRRDGSSPSSFLSFGENVQFLCRLTAPSTIRKVAMQLYSGLTGKRQEWE